MQVNRAINYMAPAKEDQISRSTKYAIARAINLATAATSPHCAIWMD